MITEVLTGAAAIAKGAELIRMGEVVAFPTETVYGLGGNALLESSVDKIYKAKGRPADNPLIVHIAEFVDIYPLIAEMSERNYAVAKAFMPGAITILFPKSKLIPDCVTAGLRNVGIRMPAHPIAREFIKKCGVPIAAPSANMSSRISPTEAQHVFDDLNGRIPLIIDGGSSDVGIESTVLDLSGDKPIILRPGAITAAMISEVIGDQVLNHVGEVIAQAPAPGMKYRHYAPKCEMEVVDSIEGLLATYDNALCDNRRAVALIKSGDKDKMGCRSYIELGYSDDEWLHNIYGAMRRAEIDNDLIICIDLSSTDKGKSAMNRVNKASKKV